MLAPVVENRTVRGSARARRRSERNSRKSPTATPRAAQLAMWRSGRRFANFQRQRGPADPRKSVFYADTPFTALEIRPVKYTVASWAQFELQYN
jgi:hypothetical protein